MCPRSCYCLGITYVPSYCAFEGRVGVHRNSFPGTVKEREKMYAEQLQDVEAAYLFVRAGRSQLLWSEDF